MIEHDIEHRDAFESLARMRDLGGVRLIVTSPPYPDARTPEQYGGACFDTTLAGYGRPGDAVREALVPGGVVALNIDGPIRVWRPELGESERSLIAFKVAIDWAERIGFRYVEHCAYVRDAMPISEGPRWRRPCGRPIRRFWHRGRVMQPPRTALRRRRPRAPRAGRPALGRHRTRASGATWPIRHVSACVIDALSGTIGA